MDIYIRKANVSDVEAIIKLKDEVWINTYISSELNITESDIKSKQVSNIDRIKSMKDSIDFKSDYFKVWVAETEGDILGMCLAQKDKDNNRINSLYISSSHQRKGLGSKLLREALIWLGDKKDVVIGVAEHNLKAISFYEKSGFKIEGYMDDYIFTSGKKMKVLRMIKTF